MVGSAFAPVNNLQFLFIVNSVELNTGQLTHRRVQNDEHALTMGG